MINILKSKKGELIEFLAVIIIVVVLIAGLMPSFNGALKERENVIINNQTSFFSSEKIN